MLESWHGARVGAVSRSGFSDVLRSGSKAPPFQPEDSLSVLSTALLLRVLSTALLLSQAESSSDDKVLMLHQPMLQGGMPLVYGGPFYGGILPYGFPAPAPTLPADDRPAEPSGTAAQVPPAQSWPSKILPRQVKGEKHKNLTSTASCETRLESLPV